MLTVKILRDNAREIWADPIWSTNLMEYFVSLALNWYSEFRPRLVTEPLTLTAGVQKYALPDTLIDLLEVEYPAGFSPPEFSRLIMASEASRYVSNVCWISGGTSSNTTEFNLVFLRDVASGESCNITYHARIDAPSDVDEVIPIPSHHEAALQLYVHYKALSYREAEEGTDPTRTVYLLEQLGEQKRRAWLQCLDAKAQILDEVRGVSVFDWGLLRDVDLGGTYENQYYDNYYR